MYSNDNTLVYQSRLCDTWLLEKQNPSFDSKDISHVPKVGRRRPWGSLPPTRMRITGNPCTPAPISKHWNISKCSLSTNPTEGPKLVVGLWIGGAVLWRIGIHGAQFDLWKEKSFSWTLDLEHRSYRMPDDTRAVASQLHQVHRGIHESRLDPG